MKFAIWCEPKDGNANGVWFGWGAQDGGRKFDTLNKAQSYAQSLKYAPTMGGDDYHVREWRAGSR